MQRWKDTVFAPTVEGINAQTRNPCGAWHRRRESCKGALPKRPLGPVSRLHVALSLFFGQLKVLRSFALQKGELFLAFSLEVLSPRYLRGPISIRQAVLLRPWSSTGELSCLWNPRELSLTSVRNAWQTSVLWGAGLCSFYLEQHQY